MNYTEYVFHQKKMIRKKLRKIIWQLLSIFCMWKIYSLDVSKNNSNCEKQVVLLMIPNGEK